MEFVLSGCVYAFSSGWTLSDQDSSSVWARGPNTAITLTPPLLNGLTRDRTVCYSGGVGAQAAWERGGGFFLAENLWLRGGESWGATNRQCFFHKHSSQQSEAARQLGVGTKTEKNINCNSLRLSSYKAVALTTLCCISEDIHSLSCIWLHPNTVEATVCVSLNVAGQTVQFI